MAPALVAAAGAHAEEEAGEEDDGNDEDHAGHDADPGGNGGQPGVATWLYSIYIGWCGGGNGAGRRFRGRGCFAHEPEDASAGDVSVLNCV
ncbi:MAG: hypothetical protein NVS4B6_07350 [Mycobacterium sp.]